LKEGLKGPKDRLRASAAARRTSLVISPENIHFYQLQLFI
jgi:hypothetical protein